MVGDITDIYVNSFERMLSDPYFTPEELSAIAIGYTKLLEESAHLLNDLKTVVNENGLSMNDKERMDIIDRCYTDMLQYRSWCNITPTRTSAFPTCVPRNGTTWTV